MPKFLKTKISRLELLKVIEGERKADIVLKNANIVNVFTKEIIPSNLVIKEDRIAFIGNSDISKMIGSSTQVIDVKGQYLVPGLIDSHLHVESSMLTLKQFAKAVLPLGTTTVIIDPHEILWTLGKSGLKIFLQDANEIPLKVFLAVPSTPNDKLVGILTPGAIFTFDDIKEMLTWERTIALGEISRLTKPDFYSVAEFAMNLGLNVEGHLANVKDYRMVTSYFAAGASSDHEAIDVEDALNRISLGIHLMIREGSAARDLTSLIKVITEKNISSRWCSFCTDDRTPSDILREGHIDFIVRRAIEEGVDPISAIQMATVNPSIYFGLDRELGSLVPGKIADVLVVKNLEKFQIMMVFASGQLVSKQDTLMKVKESKYPDWVVKTFHVKKTIKSADFKIRASIKDGSAKCNIIEVHDGTLIGKKIVEVLPVRNNEILPDIEQDIVKIACIERYGKTNLNIGLGFIKGFKIKQGAFGASIAHDTHNIVIVGTNDLDLTLVANSIVKMNGGIAAVSDGKLLSSLNLPFGGILSLESIENVAHKLERIEQNISKKLGSPFKSPIMTLSFQTCPSIPELKISDKGLIDVKTQRIIPLVREYL